MNYSKHLIYPVLAALLLTGCGSTSDSENQETQTVLTGTTTLSKGLVCVDSSNDNVCNTDEVQVQADEKGQYSLRYSGELEDGTNIIAEDGYNLVLEQENNTFTFRASYDSQSDTTNINTLTTLIANAEVNNNTHRDATSYIASKYAIDENIVEEDPLTLINDKATQIVFLTTRAIEAGVLESQRAFRDTNDTGGTVITEDDADDALFGIDIFDFDLDAFIDRLSEYLNIIYDYLVCTYNGTCDDDANATGDINTTEDSTSEVVARADLNGYWYMSKANEPTTCLEVDASNNFIHHNFINDSIEAKSYKMTYRESEREMDMLDDKLSAVVYESYVVSKSKTDNDVIYLKSEEFPVAYILEPQASLSACTTTLSNAQ